MQVNEYQKAFRIIWHVVSILIFLGFLLFIFVPQSIILKILPICVYQQTSQQSCLLCGMGRALILMTRGHLSDAASFNQFSIPFVLVLLWNEILWFLYIIKKKNTVS
jgi:hypothetical protein